MPIFIGKEGRPDMRFGTAIPGAALVKPENLDHPLNGLADSPDEWDVLFGESLAALQRLLSSRDCLSVLARCATLSAFNERREIENHSSVKGIGQSISLTSTAPGGTALRAVSDAALSIEKDSHFT